MTSPEKARPVWPWLITAAGLLWLFWVTWQNGFNAGFRAADESIDRRGGVSPDRYRENIERGRQLLNGM